MRQTVDPTLIEHYRDAIKEGSQFFGVGVLQYAKPIGKLITRTGAKTLLDYGCGLGQAYTKQGLHKRWGVPVPTLYDPAVKKFSAKPFRTFDGVICSDVLEHVPEELVDAVINELFAYADKFVWASVCCRAAKKKFPDGRNMHVTIQPFAWWQAKMTAAAHGKLYLLSETP